MSCRMVSARRASTTESCQAGPVAVERRQGPEGGCPRTEPGHEQALGPTRLTRDGVTPNPCQRGATTRRKAAARSRKPGFAIFPASSRGTPARTRSAPGSPAGSRRRAAAAGRPTRGTTASAAEAAARSGASRASQPARSNTQPGARRHASRLGGHERPGHGSVRLRRPRAGRRASSRGRSLRGPPARTERRRPRGGGRGRARRSPRRARTLSSTRQRESASCAARRSRSSPCAPTCSRRRWSRALRPRTGHVSPTSRRRTCTGRRRATRRRRPPLRASTR